jgi:protein phosphatase PTC7
MLARLTTQLRAPRLTRALHFEAAYSMIPHPLKVRTGGEDAVIATPHCLGVADGVGGWNSVGVDAGKYSRELLDRVRKRVNALEATVGTPWSASWCPVSTMRKAYDHTRSVGSSTCCLVVAEPDEDGGARKLRIANLGDSGLLVYRPSTEDVLFRSTEQQINFNTPRQLGTGSSDRPECAEAVTVEVEEGDLVIVATDGLFDNLYDPEILRILEDTAADRYDPVALQLKAQALADHAHERSLDPSYFSPYCLKEMEFFGSRRSLGGKEDDISVVVARVLSANPVRDTESVAIAPSRSGKSSCPPKRESQQNLCEA